MFILSISAGAVRAQPHSTAGRCSASWRRPGARLLPPSRRNAARPERRRSTVRLEGNAGVDTDLPHKQGIATELLRRGIADNTLRVPHQAIVEFVAAVSRPLLHGQPHSQPISPSVTVPPPCCTSGTRCRALEPSALAYLPSNLGSRFSIMAVTPSRASAVVKVKPWLRAS